MPLSRWAKCAEKNHGQALRTIDSVLGKNRSNAKLSSVNIHPARPTAVSLVYRGTTQKELDELIPHMREALANGIGKRTLYYKEAQIKSGTGRAPGLEIELGGPADDAKLHAQILHNSAIIRIMRNERGKIRPAK